MVTVVVDRLVEATTAQTHAEGKARPTKGIGSFEGDVDREVPHHCSVLPSNPLGYLGQPCI